MLWTYTWFAFFHFSLMCFMCACMFAFCWCKCVWVHIHMCEHAYGRPRFWQESSWILVSAWSFESESGNLMKSSWIQALFLDTFLSGSLSSEAGITTKYIVYVAHVNLGGDSNSLSSCLSNKHINCGDISIATRHAYLLLCW